MKLAVVGASGRMGLELLKAVINNPDCELAAAIVRDSSELLNQPVKTLQSLAPEHLMFSDNLKHVCHNIDGVIDFTSPAYSMEVAKICASHGKFLVNGTSGLSKQQFDELREYAIDIPIVHSSNMSLGINILLGLVRQTAQILGDDFDIEISEMHHKHKKDAPSGTALMLGEAAANGRQVKLGDKAVYSRHGMIGERKAGEIGFATLRGGSVTGDHSVMFAGVSEIIELKHHAVSRDIFAKGAVHAALWLKDKPADFYNMQDVLF